MRRNILIALNVLLFLIFISELILITPHFINNQPEEVVAEKAQPIEIPSPTPITTSILPVDAISDLSWKVVESTDPSSILQTTKTLLYTRFGSPINNLSITGSEWESSGVVTAEMDNTADIRRAYTSMLSDAGWVQQLKYDDKTVKVIAADGPSGGIMGYLKETDNAMQVIIIDHMITPLSEPSRQSQSLCPCEYTYRVFISNPIPVADVLKEYKE